MGLPRYRMIQRYQPASLLRSRYKSLFASIHKPRLTLRKRTFSNPLDSCSITLLNSSHGSAHDAQKLRTETRFKSADSSSLKCSGDVTSTRFVDGMIALFMH